MPRPTQRIVVDGVDFASIFRFTRILRCVTAALQPPRLVVGLLVVVALAAFGKTWDRATTPTVHADGYLAGERSADDEAAARAVVLDTLAGYQIAADVRPAGGSSADIRAALELLDHYYRLRRENLIAPVAGAPAPDDVVLSSDRAYLASRAALLAMAPRGPFQALVFDLRHGLERAVRGVGTLRAGLVIEAGRDVFVRLPVAVWKTQRGFALSYGAWALLVIALGGAALSRMAACELAGEERLRVRDAVDFALGNGGRVLLTPVLPLAIAAILASLLAGFGYLARFPGLDVLAGVLYGLGLVVGFAMAMLLLSYAVAFFMLLPAVAVENCDAVDAHQRAFAYALNRPMHLLGYGLVALVGLALGYVVVAFVAASTLNLTGAAAGALGPAAAGLGAGEFSLFEFRTAGPVIAGTAWHEVLTAGLIDFWQTIVVDLVVAWVVSYYFFSATAVYLLLRRACDGQDLEEIWRPGLVPGTLVPMPTGAALGDRVIERTLRGVQRVRGWRR